jgi:hypothetical protein
MLNSEWGRTWGSMITLRRWRKSDVLWQPERGPEEALPLTSPLTEKRHLGHFQNRYGESKEQLKTLVTEITAKASRLSYKRDCRLYSKQMYCQLCTAEWCSI